MGKIDAGSEKIVGKYILLLTEPIVSEKRPMLILSVLYKLRRKHIYSTEQKRAGVAVSIYKRLDSSGRIEKFLEYRMHGKFSKEKKYRQHSRRVMWKDFRR